MWAPIERPSLLLTAKPSEIPRSGSCFRPIRNYFPVDHPYMAWNCARAACKREIESELAQTRLSHGTEKAFLDGYRMRILFALRQYACAVRCPASDNVEIGKCTSIAQSRRYKAKFETEISVAHGFPTRRAKQAEKLAQLFGLENLCDFVLTSRNAKQFDQLAAAPRLEDIPSSRSPQKAKRIWQMIKGKRLLPGDLAIFEWADSNSKCNRIRNRRPVLHEVEGTFW